MLRRDRREGVSTSAAVALRADLLSSTTCCRLATLRSEPGVLTLPCLSAAAGGLEEDDEEEEEEGLAED